MNVLCQLGDEIARKIEAAVPGVTATAVPGTGPVPDDARGEVLVTPARGSENIADVLARGVQWVHAFGTGVDSFPLDALGDRLLTCSRGASAIPISEWVLAVMLAFAKRLPEVWLTEEPKHWNFPAGGSLRTLYDRRLALIGLGGIGTGVAERALPFGMRVRALRRTAAPSPVDGVEIVDSLDEVLRDADHVVVTAPATPETRYLVDARAFAAMKPGVHLVNIARGALVDQDALRVALDDGTVARATLDTVDPEPLPEGHWLYSHPRVRLSAHVSWSMPDAADLLLGVFTENLRRYRKGDPMLGIVDTAAGY